MDGSENTFSNIYTKKLYEVQRYITVTDHGYLGYVVLINESLKAEVRELSPEEKAAWREALLPLHEVFAPVIGKDLMDAVREAKEGPAPAAR